MLNLLLLLWALIEHNFSIFWRDDDFTSLVGSALLAISFIIGIARARAQMKN